MASHGLLVFKPPSQEVMLNHLLENVRYYHGALSRFYVGVRCGLDIDMPLLLKPPRPVGCWEPLAEFEAVNAHFSANVHAFFTALHTLEEMAAKTPSPELDLINCDLGIRPTIRTGDQSFDIGPDCLHRFFHTRPLAVLNPSTLPFLHRVTQFRLLPYPDHHSDPNAELPYIGMRPVSPRVLLDLAVRLPNLRELECPWLWERLPVAYSSRAIGILTRIWEAPWADARAEFGRAVREALPLLSPSLRKVRLWFWKPNPYGNSTDQAVPMPDLVGGVLLGDEFGGMDPVSVGLRQLGSRLEEFDIRALITPDLFLRHHSDSDSVLWPRMRHLTVEFYPCAPDGRWYFSGPRGEDPYPTGYTVTKEQHYPPGREDVEETHEMESREEDETEHVEGQLHEGRRPDMFRICPIAERINPLLLGFASAVRRMSCLEDAELFTWLMWQPSEERAKEYEGCEDVPPPTDCETDTVMFRWGVRYDAPKGDGKGKVTWQVGGDWRPGHEVMKAFEDLVVGDRENMEWKAFEYVVERELEFDDFL